jgi:site-specific DNA recombinase
LPGCELEQTLTRAARELLDDRAAVMAALHEAEIPPHQMKTIMSSFKALDDETILETILTRVELAADGVTLTLSLFTPVNEKAAPMSGNIAPSSESEARDGDKDAPIILTKTIPMRIKRRGVEARLIIGDNAPTHIDPTLLRAIARAQTWLTEFLSGSVPSMAAIAKRNRVDTSALSRMLSLAFLAPDIIEAIIAGRQPADLTTQKLLRDVTIPLDWAEQKRALGFGS